MVSTSWHTSLPHFGCFDEALDVVPFVLLDAAIGSPDPSIDWSILISGHDMAAVAQRFSLVTRIEVAALATALRGSFTDNRLVIADLAEVEEGNEARIELSFVEFEEATGMGSLAVAVVPDRLFAMFSALAEGGSLVSDDFGMAMSEYLGFGSFSS